MALGSPTAVRSPYQQPTLDPPTIAAWMRRAADLIEQHGNSAADIRRIAEHAATRAGERL